MGLPLEISVILLHLWQKQAFFDDFQQIFV